MRKICKREARTLSDAIKMAESSQKPLSDDLKGLVESARDALSAALWKKLKEEWLEYDEYNALFSKASALTNGDRQEMLRPVRPYKQRSGSIGEDEKSIPREYRQH